MTIVGRTFNNVDVNINICDYPVRITRDIVVLMRKPGSELIKHQSIHRVDEINGTKVMEYAYAFDSNYKFCGFVVYKDKFRIWNSEKNELLDIEPDMSFVGNPNKKLLQLLNDVTDPIKFKFDGSEYLFKHIIGSTHEGLLVYSHKGPKLLNIKDESEVTVI